MGRSQRRSILHMGPQIPKLLEAHPADIHNIIALRDRRAGVVSIHERRAQRHHEADQVLVEREEAQQFRGRLAVCLCFRVGLFGGLLVGCHSLAV